VTKTALGWIEISSSPAMLWAADEFDETAIIFAKAHVDRRG
jgi:hypothetical protein